MNNVNSGFIAENENYFYITNAKFASLLLKVDKKTKETFANEKYD